MEHRLYRSRRERAIAGVAGGLGEYFSLDPVLIRLLFIVLALATTGWAVLVYVILWVALPESPVDSLVQGAEGATYVRSYHRLDARERGVLLGGTLIVLGLIFLARALGFLWVTLRWLGPLLLIVAGVLLVLDYTRRGA